MWVLRLTLDLLSIANPRSLGNCFRSCLAIGQSVFRIELCWTCLFAKKSISIEVFSCHLLDQALRLWRPYCRSKQLQNKTAEHKTWSDIRLKTLCEYVKELIIIKSAIVRQWGENLHFNNRSFGVSGKKNTSIHRRVVLDKQKGKDKIRGVYKSAHIQCQLVDKMYQI